MIGGLVKLLRQTGMLTMDNLELIMTLTAADAAAQPDHLQIEEMPEN